MRQPQPEGVPVDAQEVINIQKNQLSDAMFQNALLEAQLRDARRQLAEIQDRGAAVEVDSSTG